MTKPSPIARGRLRGALLCASVLLAGCDDPAPPPSAVVVRPIKAVTVADPSQFGRREFPGVARGTQEVELAFRVAGPLIERPVDVGSTVKPSDLIARIDPRDYEVNLRTVEGQLARAHAALERSAADFDRSQRIFSEDPGAISETAVDRAREQRDRAAADVRSLEASVDAARDQLAYTELESPMSGTVVATYVENFEDVRAKQAIVRLVDDSRVEMVISVPESLISYAPEVTELRVTFDAFPALSIPARIKEIGTSASTTTRTYPVTLIMDQPDGARVLSGMAGKATGTPPARSGQSKVVVPVSAVFSPGEEDGTFVWVIDGATNTVTRRAVTIGEVTANGIEVADGLAPGDTIAAAGVSYLKEGQEVRPFDASGEQGGQG